MTIVNTGIPVVSGTPVRGNILSTTDGTWTSTDPLEFDYQWLRCDAFGNNCSNIASANQSTYLLANADVGSTIRSQVTATEVPTPPVPPTGNINSFDDVSGPWESPISAINKCKPPSSNGYENQGDPCPVSWPSGGGISEVSTIHGAGFNFLVDAGSGLNEMKSGDPQGTHGRKMCFLVDQDHFIKIYNTTGNPSSGINGSRFLGTTTDFTWRFQLPSAGNPDGFTDYGDWNCLIEFHESGNVENQVGIDGSVNKFYVRTRDPGGSPRRKVLGPSVQYDHWFECRWKIKWAWDSSGTVEFWIGDAGGTLTKIANWTGAVLASGTAPRLHFGYYSAIDKTNGVTPVRKNQVQYAAMNIA